MRDEIGKRKEREKRVREREREREKRVSERERERERKEFIIFCRLSPCSNRHDRLSGNIDKLEYTRVDRKFKLHRRYTCARVARALERAREITGSEDH
jgi:predicted phosphohydrolase